MMRVTPSTWLQQTDLKLSSDTKEPRSTILPQRMTDPAPIPRRKPSWLWYVLSAFIFLTSLAIFVGSLIGKSAAVHNRIEQMPRFVGPTETGSVIEIAEPGKHIIYHENKGTFGDRSFQTPRRQVWPTFASPAMTCSVVREVDGQAIEVRLPGVSDTVKDKREVNEDLIPTYDLADRQGHGVWLFEVTDPGRYRVTVTYVPDVMLDAEDIEVPAELTKAEMATITREQGKQLEEARRIAIERLQLARLEPVEVLFAVGEDPSRGSFFNVIGLKGAATVLAFGFTVSALIALVTLMLRGGHVTQRGELSDARRGMPGVGEQ